MSRGRPKGTKDKNKRIERFSFPQKYKEIMEQAKQSGMWDDMIFQTLMREFKNINSLCVELKKDLDKSELSYYEEGKNGQSLKKSNPVIKDYVAAQKNLVNIAQKLDEKLANVKPLEDDESVL